MTILICSGAKICATDNKNRTPLLLTAKQGNVRALKALLEKKASIDNQREEEGKTAVHLAAEEGKSEFLKVSIFHG